MRPLPLLLLPCLLLAQYVEDSIVVSGSWIGWLCYNPSTDLVYGCAELRDGFLFAIDCSTNEVTHSIPLHTPHGVAYDSTDNKVYCVSGGGVDSVFIFDGTTLARIASVPLEYTMHPVWDPVANRLYVAEHEDRRVVVIDCSTDTVIKRIRTSTGPMRIHLNSRHRKLYVQCYDSERLNIIDLNTLEVIENISLPGYPEAGCYGEGVDKYYCGAGVGVVVVDGSSDTVVKSIMLSHTHPISAVSVESHSLVMVGGYTGGIDSVYIIDAAGDSVVKAISGFARPSYLHWSALTDLVYCSNTHRMANQVTVITGNGSGIQDVLQVGEGPSFYAAAPRHRRLYVACTKIYVIRDTVSAIAETPEPERAEPLPGPTIVGRTLWLGQSGDRPSSGGTVPVLLLDPAGRVVMHLHPGENDISRLAPGVYFLRPATAIRRVVVTR